MDAQETQPAAESGKNTGRKVVATALVLGLIGILAGLGTWSAFSDTTTNDDNDFQSGTVEIGDDDDGAAMFDVSDMAPGETEKQCIKVSYTGSLGASVKLYGATTGTGLDQYLDLKVTRGTNTSPFSSCANFSADAGGGVLFNDTLEAYPDGYAAGITDPTASWTNPESHAYEFEVTLQSGAPNAAQGLDADQQFTWEARSN